MPDGRRTTAAASDVKSDAECDASTVKTDPEHYASSSVKPDAERVSLDDLLAAHSSFKSKKIYGKEPEAATTSGTFAAAREPTLTENTFTISGALFRMDNLEFLRSVQESLRHQIRFIYIDPPYNTGNDAHVYNDSYKRDEWLAFMRQRLELSRPLLTNDGSICVSIDDREMPYLRLMLDEIFGEENFVACIAYERSGSAGLGQAGVILNTKEYVLFYCLDKSSLTEIGYERPIDFEVMKRYNKILRVEGTRKLVDEIVAPSNQSVARLYEHENFVIEPISLRAFASRQEEIAMQYAENFDAIFRTQNVQKENTFQNGIIARLDKKSFYSLDYVPSRGKYKDEQKRLYYSNGELCAWLKDSATLVDDADSPKTSYSKAIVKRNKLTDFWSHKEIPKADLGNEGGVNFKRSKKPEHLLYRLIAMTTSEGDLVLDYFLGSGTTAAVAHKMKRKWIGVESGPFFEVITLTRLKNVIEGDQTGVSRMTGWHGGGAFAVLSSGRSED